MTETYDELKLRHDAFKHTMLREIRNLKRGIRRRAEALDSAYEELSRCTQRIVELETALAPFAKEAAIYEDAEAVMGDALKHLIAGQSGEASTITIGDCQRAAAVLAKRDLSAIKAYHGKAVSHFQAKADRQAKDIQELTRAKLDLQSDKASLLLDIKRLKARIEQLEGNTMP